MHSVPNDHAACALVSALALAALLFVMNAMGEATGVALYLGRVML